MHFWKWYFSMASIHFIPIWTNLDKNFWPYLCCIEMICFNFGRLKKLNLRLFYLSLHFCAYTILFQFGWIWMNLNETFRPYSCDIKMIFFNDEKLKKWNLRLLKPSMCIVKNRYVLLKRMFHTYDCLRREKWGV